MPQEQLTPSTAPGASFWRRDLAWTLGTLVLLLAWEASGLDLASVRVWGDSQGFAWREAWLTRGLLHEGGRGLAWVVFGVMLLGLWRPWLKGPSRGERITAIVGTLTALLVVPGFKRLSHTSCPWDLSEFGGVAQYVPHWQLGLFDGGPGHCFPSGHAAAAFAFFSLYFLWRHHHPALARLMLVGVLALGALFAWAQLARGAHYPSHSLWSAWLCWVAVMLVFLMAPRLKRLRPAAAGAARDQA